MEFCVYGGTICCCNTSVKDSRFFLITLKMRCISTKATIPVGFKCLYFSPWKCQGSWPARSAAALERLPPAHRCPGCPSTLWRNGGKNQLITFYAKDPCSALLPCTYMCSVDTWLRLWANWEARFSSRQPKRQVTSSAILPLYKRLLVVVAGRGEGRGSWFNTKERDEGTVSGQKRKTVRRKTGRTQSNGSK